jgi:flagellar hook-length control protein FliK
MMNIESSNLISVLPGSIAIEGTLSSSPVEGAIAEVFGDALKVQLQLLAESNNINQTTAVQVTETLAPVAHPADAPELAGLLGNDLPVSYQLDDKNDVHAALDVVTDSLKYLKADTVALPATDQMSSTLSAQLTQLQTDEGKVNAEQLQVNLETGQLQVKPSKSDNIDSERVKKEELQHAEDSANPIAQVAQMVLMPVELAQLPVSSAPSDGNKETEQLTLINAFSENGKSKSTIGTNQIIKGEELQKAPDQEKLALFDVVLNKQGEAVSKAALNDQLFSTGSDAAINVAGTAVNGQFDKAVSEAKTDVPALTRPITHPEWNKDLGERIMWMNNRAISAAEIKLNPQHLGPVSVRIDMNQDQASIVFTAQHAAVRDALEASVPKLREMMNDQQINLVNVSVAQNGGSEQRNSQPQSFNQVNGDAAVDAADDLGITEHEHVTVSNGLLNMYA